MKTLLVSVIHYIYDETLLPLKRENIANYITVLGSFLSRIGLAFFFIYFLFFLESRELSGVVWVSRWIGISCLLAASLCDLFDGLVARWLKITSSFGELYDPHTDKVQYLTKLNSVFLDAVVMLLAGIVSPILLLQIVLIAWATYERDATVMFHRSWAIRESPGVCVKAKPSGKWRTLICFPGILFFHLILQFGSVMWGWIDTIIILSITIISMRDYVLSYREVIKAAHRNM